MDNSKALLEKLYTIFLICYPLLSVYKSPVSSINLPNLFMIVILISLLITKRIKIQLSVGNTVNFLYIFAGICLFLALISSLITQEYSMISIFGRFTLFILYIIILSVSRTVLDFELAIRLVKVISIVGCISLLIQIIAYYTLNLNIHMYLPFLPLTDGMSKSINNLIYENYSTIVIYRPMTVFGEPSHFAYYVVMALAVLLFIDKKVKKRNKLFLGLLYSIALVLSTSGTGAYLMVLIWTIYLLNNKKNRAKNLIIVFVFIFMTLTFMYISGNTFEYFNYAFSRLTISSSRMFSFLNYLGEMDFGLQLIGSGMGNSSIYFKEMNDDAVSSFMSSFGRIFVESGYIGILIFMGILIMLYINTRRNMRIFVFIFIIGCLIESTIFSIYLPLYLIWPMAFSYKYEFQEIGNKKARDKF
ncbi:O-antigen polymerase [Neobacillus niacini]|uniref:O-antigen polymerase n=1 Tax=Neobacillus niacini TaxID=86668 RepID=UPI00203EB67A|nr:O-antigen polymerase [Neobacillus niacini]MCM3693200.1 oligosaccharide repeat unit polymerase [Neobacillus niacini]